MRHAARQTDAQSFLGIARACLRGNSGLAGLAISPRVRALTAVSTVPCLPVGASRCGLTVSSLDLSPESSDWLDFIPWAAKGVGFVLVFGTNVGISARFEKEKEDGQEPLVRNVTQETQAEMVGTTGSRVRVFMNRFRKLGFIDYSDGLRGSL
jgi:hypothetical protein